MAKATRYRDLESLSLIDVRARSESTGAADVSAQLANTFASFSKLGSDVGAQLSAQIGQRQGAAAGAAGPPKMRSSLTAFGSAYNNAALRSYAIRSEADADETAARLEVEAGTDPEKFRLGMDEVRRATLAEAPAEAKSLIDEVYVRRTGAGLARIQGALAKEIRDEDRTLVSEGIAQHVERISFLKTQDDDASAVEAAEETVKLNLLIDGAHNTGSLTAIEAAALRRTSARDIIFSTVKQRFRNELDDPNGDPISMIEAVKDIVRTDQSLTPEEEAKLENELFAELSDKNAIRTARQTQQAAADEARYAAGDKVATELMLSHKLTNSRLLELLERDQIKPAIARTLQNELDSPTRVAKSDQKELMTVETNLLNYSEEDIRNNTKLTFADRSDLILKRRNESLGWKGTQTAKEAFDRIDRALGIVPGTNPRFLTEDELRARDAALTELYDAIDALPPEERQAAVMMKSEEVVRNRIRTSARAELATLRERFETYKTNQGDPAQLRGQRLEDYKRNVASYERRIQELSSEAQ